jgi:hypothetical protein
MFNNVTSTPQQTIEGYYFSCSMEVLASTK